MKKASAIGMFCHLAWLAASSQSWQSISAVIENGGSNQWRRNNQWRNGESAWALLASLANRLASAIESSCVKKNGNSMQWRIGQ